MNCAKRIIIFAPSYTTVIVISFFSNRSCLCNPLKKSFYCGQEFKFLFFVFKSVQITTFILLNKNKTKQSILFQTCLLAISSDSTWFFRKSVTVHKGKPSILLFGGKLFLLFCKLISALDMCPVFKMNCPFFHTVKYSQRIGANTLLEFWNFL